MPRATFSFCMLARRACKQVRRTDTRTRFQSSLSRQPHPRYFTFRDWLGATPGSESRSFSSCALKVSLSRCQTRHLLAIPPFLYIHNSMMSLRHAHTSKKSDRNDAPTQGNSSSKHVHEGNGDPSHSHSISSSHSHSHGNGHGRGVEKVMEALQGSGQCLLVLISRRLMPIMWYTGRRSRQSDHPYWIVC
jgi:hypothetical protein